MVLNPGLAPDEIRLFGNPGDVSPEGFERLVHSWLATHGPGSLEDFKVRHLSKVPGAGGEYEIDVAVEFTIFGGARILTLVECKHQKQPVKRDQVLVLEAKLRDTGAHKGVVFSTSGFQRGAVEYARRRGIATVTVRNGQPVYYASDCWLATAYFGVPDHESVVVLRGYRDALMNRRWGALFKTANRLYYAMGKTRLATWWREGLGPASSVGFRVITSRWVLSTLLALARNHEAKNPSWQEEGAAQPRRCTGRLRRR